MLTTVPVIWSARIADTALVASDVTVIVRVTYNTLEAICHDAFVLTETHVARWPS